MTITKIIENNNLKLDINGRLDSTTSGEFEKVLEDITDDVASLTINMEKVDYISSKGLRIIVTIYKKMAGKPMEIINANSAVKEVFHLSGLTKIFNL